MKKLVWHHTSERSKVRDVPENFYLERTDVVAQKLLGKILVHQVSADVVLSGRIVETEAYLGVQDRACHSFGGRDTARVKPLYLSGGHIYVYVIYGLHECFNVVTRGAGVPEAVLIRALEPIDGIEEMKKRRGTDQLHQLCSGPGKLCQAMGIKRAQTGQSLLTSSVRLVDDGYKANSSGISRGPRIGIAYAGRAAQLPLRFWIKGNPHVSKLKK